MTDKFYFEESGVIEDSVLKTILLESRSLDNMLSTILHDNLWDLYEEDDNKLTVKISEI